MSDARVLPTGIGGTSGIEMPDDRLSRSCSPGLGVRAADACQQISRPQVDAQLDSSDANSEAKGKEAD